MYPLALPFSPPLAPPGPPGSWNLPTRPRRDGRRGAVSVVHIPLYLGRHVPLPLTRAHSPFRHVWLCAAVLRARALSLRASRCVGLARAPGQLESSRSASTRRAARSGECRAYPVVFGLPCPFAFNARAFGCARLCCARAHYRCAQVCMGLLYGRAGRLTAKNGGFRPGQWWSTRAR
jgi:hypothetical protein